MPIELGGKPIVITGASSGIGAATAIACAAAGMPVAIGARRQERLNEVVDVIRKRGGRAIAQETDVTNPASCAALVDSAVREFGSLYAVYANAGYGDEVAVDAMSDERMRAIFETNYFGTLNTIRPALPHLRRNPGPHRGHVLICSSCLARMTIPYYGAYSATKAAQAHIGRAMMFELEPEGIHVSTVHPIGTKTELFDLIAVRSAQNGGAAQLIAHSPDRFMQTPEFVARKTLACLRRPRSEVWTGFSGGFVRFGMSVCSFAPWMSNLVLRGMVKRRLAEFRKAANKQATQSATH